MVTTITSNKFIGNDAFNFTSEAVMQDGSFKENFNLKSYLDGKYGIIFFYPLDFTFVCPSEILAFNDAIDEFESLNTKILGVSIDSKFSHYAWRNTPINDGGIGNINFPLISDLKREISSYYELLCNDSIAFRGTIIIDGSFKIVHYSVQDLPIGRNVDEFKRIITAVQHIKEHGEVCPANWKKGEKAMIASKSGVAKYLKEQRKV